MQQDKEKLPLDAKLLSLAIIELNISRRNVSIYPENHPSVRNSIKKAHGHLQSLFELRSEITLAAAKDTLVIDEYFLDRKNPVYAEFAGSMHRMGLAAVTFCAGVTEDELIKFHQMLCTDPEDLSAHAGGAVQLMSEAGITHLRAKPIDYGAFHFVQGQRAHADQGQNIWEEYVYGLLEGKLVSQGESEKIRGIPPQVLSQIINRQMDESSGQESYEKVITAYLQSSATESRLKKGALSNVTQFIEGLKPALKRQFLSGTFAQISPDPALAKRISQELSSEQLMALLREINERDSVMPDTLRNLMEKFSRIQRGTTVALGIRENLSGQSIVDDIQMSQEILKLFEDESGQDFVTSDYRAELKRILASEVSAGEHFSLDEIKAEFGSESLEAYLKDVYLELLEDPNLIDDDEIPAIAGRFIENVNMFLQTGQFGQLCSVYDAMLTMRDNPRYGKMAESVFDYITSEEFIQNLVAFYRFWGRKNRHDVIEFSARIKRFLIPHLIEALIQETDASLRSFYLSILSGFGEEVIPFALQHLSDQHWFVRRNMLILLRESGDKSVLKHIRPFCEDKNIRIAMEAMKAFLDLNDTQVLRYLRQYLTGGDLQGQEQVLKLIGAYRVKQLVPDILKLLLKKDIIGGDFHLKIPLVKALGDIGDPRALKYLLEIISTKSLLYKSSLDALKVEIYKSLKHYPSGEISPLLEEGMKSKNEAIISICRRLSARQENAGD